MSSLKRFWFATFFLFVILDYTRLRLLQNTIGKHDQHSSTAKSQTQTHYVTQDTRYRNATFQPHLEKQIVQTSTKIRISLPEKSMLKSILQGYYFTRAGEVEEVKGVPFTTSFLYSWSPDIEREASEKFLDVNHENVYRALSPSITLHHNTLLFVCRIWLNQEGFLQSRVNRFTDNSVFVQRYDENMTALESGSLLGIKTPDQWKFGHGPRGLRLFTVNGRPYIIFGTAVLMNMTAGYDSMYLWDIEKRKVIIPVIQEGAPMARSADTFSKAFIKYYDKNWMPLDIDGILHIVYTLDPLMVLRCNFDGVCRFVHSAVNQTSFPWSSKSSFVRGGTPFVLYKFPYYISIAHCTLYALKPPHTGRYYTSHIVVLRVRPFSVVFISEEIELHKDMFKGRPRQRAYVRSDFLFPEGLVLEDEDSAIVSGHVNDHSSVMIRITGLQELMHSVMQMDDNNDNTQGQGPKVTQIHQLIRKVQIERTSIPFL